MKIYRVTVIMGANGAKAHYMFADMKSAQQRVDELAAIFAVNGKRFVAWIYEMAPDISGEFRPSQLMTPKCITVNEDAKAL